MSFIVWAVVIYVILGCLLLALIGVVMVNAKSIRNNDMIKINGQKYWYINKNGKAYLTNGINDLDIEK